MQCTVCDQHQVLLLLLLPCCRCCDTQTQLPQRSKPTEVVVEGVDYDPDDTYSSDDSKSASDNSSDSQEQLPWCEQFLQLHAEIESAIEQLGGQVAPKLNWSSPTDALWISSYNSLKCCNADQVSFRWLTGLGHQGKGCITAAVSQVSGGRGGC